MASERERGMMLADKWARESSELYEMAKDGLRYTAQEASLLKERALSKHSCAQELRIEMSRVSRG